MDYRIEWMPAVAVVGLVTLLFVPVLGFLIALAIVALAALALLALAGALLAAPLLLGLAARRRWQEASDARSDAEVETQPSVPEGLSPRVPA